MDKIGWRYIAHVLDPGFITPVTKKKKVKKYGQRPGGGGARL